MLKIRNNIFITSPDRTVGRTLENKKKLERLEDYTNNRKIAVTPCLIEGNGCTFNPVVGNFVPDTPVNVQPTTRRIGPRRPLFV